MNSPQFDYVIVGGGSAGCVLANRLSADGRTSVALLEAGGPDRQQEIHIPAAFSKLFRSKHDWNYQTEEQRHLNGRRLYWPRGKVLGGSSSMNAMVYTRGDRRDYDDWARVTGDPGWGYERVLPFFRRAESRAVAGQQDPAPPGPLSVCGLRTVNPLSHAFLSACQEKGITRVPDFNGDSVDGAGLFEVTQRGGKRHSGAVAYLKPALSRRNLTVFTHAHATRVVFDGVRAKGVEFVHEGATKRVEAGCEVILSGGAVNSPQLLMLSGVGPADDLTAHGIPVVADLPAVGRNLQDHVFGAVVHESRKPLTLAAAESVANILKFLVFRRGMLTSNVAEAGAFVRVGEPAGRADIELIFGPVYYMGHGFLNPAGHGFTVGAILLHPKSTGTIRLRSADPLEAPVIDPNYLHDPEDARLLTAGVRVATEVTRQAAFEPFRGTEVWPGVRGSDASSLEAFIRDTTETIYHPVGTCRMGDDVDAAVDARLRVRGVERLRVADASIMPSLVTGHPNAAVVMIAERAAEMIRDSH